jgi:hypothetical protein
VPESRAFKYYELSMLIGFFIGFVPCILMYLKGFLFGDTSLFVLIFGVFLSTAVGALASTLATIFITPILVAIRLGERLNSSGKKLS